MVAIAYFRDVAAGHDDRAHALTAQKGQEFVTLIMANHEMAKAYERLQTAGMNAFGTHWDVVPGAPLRPSDELYATIIANLQNATVQTDGGKAVVIPTNSRGAVDNVNLVKVGKDWLMDLPDMEAQAAEEEIAGRAVSPKIKIATVKRQGEYINQLAEKIENGTISSMAEFRPQLARLPLVVAQSVMLGDLRVPANITAPRPTGDTSESSGSDLRSRLIGSWQAPNHVCTYTASGKFGIDAYPPYGTYAYRWKLKGNSLITQRRDGSSPPEVARIIKLTGEELIMQADGHVFRATRIHSVNDNSQ